MENRQQPPQSPQQSQQPQQPPHIHNQGNRQNMPYQNLNTQRGYEKLGGSLITFIVLQSIYIFGMLMQLPDSIAKLASYALEGNIIYVVTSVVSALTLIIYSLLGVMFVINLALGNSKFFRRFQLAGIIAFSGNLVVFIIKQFVETYNSYGYGLFYATERYYWALSLLALFWTVFWSIFFIKSNRTYVYMGKSREYIDSAIFGGRKPVQNNPMYENRTNDQN